jgi:hypothetical protein
MIRIDTADRAVPVKLDFGTTFGDRDAIRDVLSMRLTPDGAANAAETAQRNAGTSASANPSATPSLENKPQISVDWAALSAEERKWREILFRKKDVFSLYRRIVESGIIEDETFWKGMKCKYKPNGQRRGTTSNDVEEFGAIGSDKGVPSAAFDQAGDCGQEDASATWAGEVPNAGERHRIFMEHPAVLLAYRAKVLDAKPGAKMTEAAFWVVYRKSTMGQRHLKGSKRGAAVATEADAMFAEFHAREKRVCMAEEQHRASLVDKSLNLRRFDGHRQEHVLQGHVVGGEAPRGFKRQDGTTNAAGESRGLDLMRKLNRHGAMVVEGVSDGVKDAWHENAEERTHPLPDLENMPAREYSQLMVESETAFFAAQGRGLQTDFSANGTPRDEHDAQSRATEAKLKIRAAFMSKRLTGWEPNLGRLAHGHTMAGETLEEVLTAMRP